MKKIKRVFLIVLDSLGVGAAPDAADFGDGACNTLLSLVRSEGFSAPHLASLGLFSVDGIKDAAEAAALRVPAPRGAFARLQESSRGKDTTTGHWELAGVVGEHPMPTYPEGFPPEIIAALEASIGRKLICNKPYSGTQVIHDYGREHIETGALIVYTSADSVLQLAAHENVVPREELYEACRKARAIMQGKHGVGRVIARPFIGEYPNYERTAGRHDFSLEPPATVLDALKDAGFASIGVGKISDIFAGKGLTKSLGTNEDNADGMKKTRSLLGEDFTGLAFVNLVDFDMVFGHRRDTRGYARAVMEFDAWLGDFLAAMKETDVLMITADHGCDPGAPGTDHTREYVPLLAYGAAVRAGCDLGTRLAFADVGATIAEIFGVEFVTRGRSFWREIAAG